MPYPSDLQLTHVTTIDDCYAMKRWLSEDRGREMVGMDFETSGLDAYSDDSRIRLIQIGDGHHGWAVPWGLWGGAALECLDAWPGLIGIHKASFEAAWFSQHSDWQFPWERVHDVMLHAQIIRPEAPPGLKETATRLVDRRAAADAKNLANAFRKQGWDWNTVPLDFPTYVTYAALDPVITVLLWEKLRADLKYPETFDLEMGAQRVCTKMSIKGATVNTPYAQKNLEVLEKQVDKGKKWAANNLFYTTTQGATKAVNINAPAQLVSHFQGTLGQEITEKSAKTGNPSVNKVQLAKFVQGGNERVAKTALFLMKYRYAERLRGSYFENIINRTRNGLIHCGINPMGAITGRMSIQQPSLQNLPKNDPLVRGCFVPREGNVIVSSDLDQVEFRLFASMSKDAALIQAFIDADASGGDAFTEIGKQIYGDPTMTKDDPRRAIIKTYIYSMLFGAGLEKQAKSANVTLAEMTAFSRTIKNQYPGMEKFQQSIYDAVGRRERDEGQGYVLTPTTGRRLPIVKKDGKTPTHKGVNYTIQSSAADIFKRNLLELEARGLGEYMMIPVHDEIVLDAPRDMLADIEPILRDCMTTIDPDNWALALTAGVDGPFERWGQKNKMSLAESLQAGVAKQLADSEDTDEDDTDFEEAA